MGKLEEYEVMKLLGKGSFGSVYCVRRINDRSLHVMKKISIHNMPQKERSATEQECKVLQRLRHPGIVCYEDSFIHKNRQLCIVMAFCEGGDLSTVIEKRKMRLFPEQEVISWFLQISLALQYMHDEHILHRDLKTQNIFLTKSGIIKLGDFGIAKVLEGTLEMAKTVIGTPYYMSPELFRNQPYSYKSDIWSLGCVLYELVGLRHAFEARDMNSLVQKILRANYAPIPSTASKDVRELVKSMLALAPGSRPSVNQVLALPFIRKEMGNYIQTQLGDDSAASLLKEDPKLIQFIQQEQLHLEEQARKLGFEIKKRNTHPEEALLLQAPRALLPLPPNARPSNQSLPSAQDVEREKVEKDLREKERQKRAQAFLERELRAKERAEQALKQLQKEKQERLVALQEQRQLRQKRMSGVHPRGEAGLMNDWQKRLQQAQVQHEQRRRDLGMVPGDHRPKPPPKSRLETPPKMEEEDLRRQQQQQQQRHRAVLEQRNQADARAGDRHSHDPAAADKENVKNIFERQANQELQKQRQREKELQEQELQQREQLLHQQQEEERRKQEADALAAQKRLENERLREEMNRDMLLMEAKLKQLKAKKDEEAKLKQLKAKKHQEDRKKKAKAAAAALAAAGGEQQPSLQNKAAQQHAAAAAAAAQAMQAVKLREQLQHKSGAAAASAQQELKKSFNRDPPVRYLDSSDETPSGAPAPHPPHAYRAPQPPPHHAPQVRASADAGGFGRKHPHLSVAVDPLRHSDPVFDPPQFAPPSHPPPHRLQVLPSPMAGVSFSDPYSEVLGQGLGADLISRQKELDRQQARMLVLHETDREMQEFKMTMHRISKAVQSSAASRPMLLPAEVGARISERDRLLREKQVKQHRDSMQKRGVEVRQGALRGFADVAHDGALFSPTRATNYSGAPRGLPYGDEIEDEIEEEEMFQARGARLLSPPLEVDEQLLNFEQQEANLEQELAHRTLKIQMLKTAILNGPY